MAAPQRRRTVRIGGLARRIIGAFLGVVLAAIVTDIIVTTVTFTGGFDRFIAHQEVRAAEAAAAAAGEAYLVHGGWHSSDLGPISDLIQRSRDRWQITDSAGRIVVSSPGFASHDAGPAATAPVVVTGHRVGVVTVKFDGDSIVAAGARLSAERLHVRLYTGAIDIAIALLVAVLVSRWVTAPVDKVLAAMRIRGSGNRSYRIQDAHAAGEMGELLDGFNRSADSFDRQEKARRNLVADVTHELRTPVAVLQAEHEAMLDGLTEPTPENLASLRDEVLRLGRVLEDLGALAAAESAAMQLRLGTHDLADIAEDAANSLGEAFAAANIVLRRDLASAVVYCDYDRICEVVTNLLTNALKYTPAGGQVSLETDMAADRRGRLRVRDTGVGIPPDELPHVTERFFRGRQAAGLAGGSGFGLTIVDELVRASRGDLSIASEPGTGTTVTIVLPASRTQAK